MTLDGELAKGKLRGTKRQVRKTLGLPGHQTNVTGTQIPIFPLRQTSM